MISCTPAELSLIIPVHNEEALISKCFEGYFSHLKTLKERGLLENFEILYVCNGCEDKSYTILNSLCHEKSSVRVLEIKERGLGRGISEGIKEAKYNYSMFYSVDVPFGFNVIEESLVEMRKSENIGMVIGSKGHPQSEVKRPLSRRLISSTLNLLMRILFRLNVKDTQGSQLFLTEIAKTNLNSLNSPGPFIQAQLCLLFHKLGYKIEEIPIQHFENGRPSKMKLLKDAKKSFTELISERFS